MVWDACCALGGRAGPAGGCSPHRGPGGLRLWRCFSAYLDAWRYRARQRRALARLDAAALRDLGLSAADWPALSTGMLARDVSRRQR